MTKKRVMETSGERVSSNKEKNRFLSKYAFVHFVCSGKMRVFCKNRTKTISEIRSLGKLMICCFLLKSITMPK